MSLYYYNPYPPPLNKFNLIGYSNISKEETKKQKQHVKEYKNLI